MARPVVDLPQPDSPTRPRVSPFSTKKSTPSTARTAPTWRWKMIPWVSGKCILRAFTSSRFLPLSALAVLRDRTNSGSEGLVGVVTAISAPLVGLLGRRRWRWRLAVGLRLPRQLRDLLLDLLEDARVADLTPPVRVDEPPTTLRTPAAGFVVGLGVRDVLERRLLLAADVP